MTQHATPFGALTQLYAGTSPETKDSNGKVDIDTHTILAYTDVPPLQCYFSTSFPGHARQNRSGKKPKTQRLANDCGNGAKSRRRNIPKALQLWLLVLQLDPLFPFFLQDHELAISLLTLYLSYYYTCLKLRDFLNEMTTAPPVTARVIRRRLGYSTPRFHPLMATYRSALLNLNFHHHFNPQPKLSRQ